MSDETPRPPAAEVCRYCGFVHGPNSTCGGVEGIHWTATDSPHAGKKQADAWRSGMALRDRIKELEQERDAALAEIARLTQQVETMKAGVRGELGGGNSMPDFWTPERQLPYIAKRCNKLEAENIALRKDRDGAEIPQDKWDRERMEDGTFRVRCSRCAKSVSSPLAGPTIVRAWVECPECIEQTKSDGA